MSASVLGGMFHENGVTTLSTAHTKSALKKRIAFALGRKQLLGVQEILRTLVGVDVAGTPAASKTYGRVAASSELGGVRTIESETLIDRNTAASDVTDITADLLTDDYYDSTPVANGDGNPLGTR